METYLSIEELAKYLGVAEKTVRRWVLNGDIPYHKIMKVIRFRLSEIERWIDAGCKLSLMKDEAAADGAVLEAGADSETGAAVPAITDDVASDPIQMERGATDFVSYVEKLKSVEIRKIIEV